MSQLICTEIDRKLRSFHLQQVSFSMESGYFYVLTGINGSGKTTLLNCITGAATHFSGDVRLVTSSQKESFSLRDCPLPYRQRIGYISGSHPFFEELTVLENGQRFGAFYPLWSLEDYYQALDLVSLPPSKAAYTLSKGERIRLQTAFALSCHPEFLILDEPLAGLDPVFRNEFLHLLLDLVSQGMGVLLATHITEDVDQMADFILIMEKGRLIRCDTKEDLNDYYASLGKKNPPHIRDLLGLAQKGDLL